MRLLLALAAFACVLGCQEPEAAEPARLTTAKPPAPPPPQCAHLPATPGVAAPIPSVEALHETVLALIAPSAPHLGVAGASPDERAEYRARLRRTIIQLAPYAAGTPSAFERAWSDPDRRARLAGIFPYLLLDEYPEVVRDGEHLGARDAVAAHRATIARIYCRALAGGDTAERLQALALHSGFGHLLHFNPFERLGLGAVLSEQLGAPDRETQSAALRWLCAFEAPPRDDATVDRLRALLYAPNDNRLYESVLRGRCGNWLLARIDDHSARVLIDELFASPRYTRDAQCAFSRVVDRKHADAVRESYLRSEAGYVLPHLTHWDLAAPFLSRLELTDLVRADLESTDGDRVDRGINVASRLPPRDAAPLLRVVLARADLPNPPNGERRDWGGAVGLANRAREGLERAERRMDEPAAGDPCRSWSCNIPTARALNDCVR